MNRKGVLTFEGGAVAVPHQVSLGVASHGAPQLEAAPPVYTSWGRDSVSLAFIVFIIVFMYTRPGGEKSFV